MRTKAIAFVTIAGLAVVLLLSLRTANRADAAGGNCYSDAQGPSQVTLCD